MLSLALSGLLLLGGCNKGPAPAAPAAEPAPTAQAAAPTATPPPLPLRSLLPAACARARTCARRGSSAGGCVPPRLPRPRRRPSNTPCLPARLWWFALEQTVSAKNSNVGDSFSGVLAQSVVVHGVTVIRAGAPVTGVVTAAKGQGRFKGAGDLAIAIRRVGDYAVSTTVV